MTRPLRAVIHRAALVRNLALARSRAPDSRVMAVVKADAYGHGLEWAAPALCQADGYAVLEMDKALWLREQGYRQPILLLEGFFSERELRLAEQYRLSVTVHCAEQLKMMAAAGGRATLDVFLKLNTGMNRLGFPPGALGDALRVLKASAAVRDLVLMTHFACADEEQGVAEQLRRFTDATAGLRFPRSLANSAALLRYPETHADWVRPGIMLYGSSPFAGESAQSLDLQPGMTLESEIISVQRLEAGERVGYGGTFTAPHAMRVGIVACGYADGYPRHAGTGTPVLVAGKRTRTLGRVSMDMLCADLTPCPEAGAGAPVVLWGEGLPVDEVARAAGTISYELLCAVAPRVPVSGD